MKRTLTSAWVAFAMVALASPAVVLAQPASAQGKPLPDPKLDVGAVTVRVIRGSVARPANGIDVTLIGEGDARLTARTNAEGRATFGGLAPGATYIAEAIDGDTKVRSEQFAIPDAGGVRLLLSTAAMKASGPMARGGRPDPRMMSGMSRPQRGDPAGRVTVRAIQGAISSTESHAPVGALIHLIGISATGEVTSQTQPMDKEGRVIFDDLATDGSVAYYVQSIFTRGDGADPIADRLVSRALTLPPQVGLRLMLAGHAVDSEKPAIDDLGKLGMHGTSDVDPGRAVIRVGGEIANVDKVELFEVSDPDRVVTRPATQPIPMTSEVACEMAAVEPDPNLATNTIAVELRRARTGAMLGSAKVDIITESNTVIATATRDEKTGFFTAELPEAVFANIDGAREKLRARVTLLASTFGELKPIKTFTSKAFAVSDSGTARLRGTCSIRMSARVEARFSGLPSGADKVYIARVREGGRIHYSPPFQLTAKRGAAVDILVYDWPAFGFHFGGEVDDKTLWFQGQLALINLGTGPVMGPDGATAIPLPEGFIGADVMEPYKKRVRIDEDEGLYWRGAIPPGQTLVRTVFGLPVEDGAVTFDLALPNGAMNSQVSVGTLPGMKLDLPPGTQKDLQTMENGRTFWVISEINVRPEKRMVMGIYGLPEGAAWKTYASIGGGAAVIAFLLWAMFGLVQAGGRARAATAALDRERQRLLDDIAAIDGQRHAEDSEAERKKIAKRRARLVRDLEAIYAKLDSSGSGS